MSRSEPGQLPWDKRSTTDDAPTRERLDDVAFAAIHPSIGIARVGNSVHEYFFAPEVPNPTPLPLGAYRDSTGALKRQAARFRIYAYDGQGRPVCELTAKTASIRWTVHVANTKAAWYRFRLPLDIPEAAATSLPRRNGDVPLANRQELLLDPGPRSIEGVKAGGAAQRFFASGRFGAKAFKVYLGELRTDRAGRLVFLGGRGVSKSPNNTPILRDENDPDSFGNADGWYDDISDGPVTAIVSIDGRKIPVQPAWVVTAPPNFAPQLTSVRTLYDVLFDMHVRDGRLTLPSPVDFSNDVWPILSRLSELQWVNAGFAAQFGFGRAHDFTNPSFLKKLSTPPPPRPSQDIHAPLRRQIFNAFRRPDATDNTALPWPWVYGDAFDLPPAKSPRENSMLSTTQHFILGRWADGQFVTGASVPLPMNQKIEQFSIEEQPAILDRASLDFCIADAFHPGSEVCWPMRHSTLYAAPFRIRHRDPAHPLGDFGDSLSADEAQRPDGPLYAQAPGDVTKWLAVPWQMDLPVCRSGYEPEFDPFLPTFWPARVPNHILTQADYLQAIDTRLPREQRVAAFTRREAWWRFVAGPALGVQMLNTVKDFPNYGIVEVRSGVPNDHELPPVMMVEDRPSNMKSKLKPPAPTPNAPADSQAHAKKKRLFEAGWKTEKEAQSYGVDLDGSRRRGRHR